MVTPDGFEVAFQGEYRDAHLNSGMESGLQEALDLLEQVAVALV